MGKIRLFSFRNFIITLNLVWEDLFSMIKFGQVTAYDEATRTATISYVRPDACAKCGGCGSMNQTGFIQLKADCRVGNWVKVVLPDSRFMTATVIAYVIPLICFLAGLFIGYTASGQSELWALLGSLIGVGASLLVLRLNEKRIAGKPEWTPHVAEVYETKPDMDAIGCGGME